MPDFIESNLGTLAGAALGSIIPGIGTAIGASIGGGIQSGVESGDPLQGLLSAGGSYLGGNIASAALGPALGTVGGTLTDALGSNIGDFAGNAIGSELAGTQISGIVGSQLGSSLAESFAGNSGIETPNPMAASPAPEPFKPSRESDNALPGSLSTFANFDPNQQSTNIASQGVYGGGAGPEENSYFANLINHRLIGQEGQVGGADSLQPIEKSYISQLGLGDANDPMSILEAISKKRGSGAAFGGFA